MSTAVPRLLLDTFACLGPGGTDLIAPLVRLADGCEAAGVALCVDSAAWKEAEQDPDVRRRGVDLGAFARVQRLNTLSMPSNRDLSSRFVPVRNEADAADLRLLGALHARIADVLVTQDARVRRLADRAGIGARVLTLAEALTWVRRMQGQPMGLHVREAQPAHHSFGPVAGRPAGAGVRCLRPISADDPRREPRSRVHRHAGRTVDRLRSPATRRRRSADGDAGPGGRAVELGLASARGNDPRGALDGAPARQRPARAAPAAFRFRAAAARAAGIRTPRMVRSRRRTVTG